MLSGAEVANALSRVGENLLIVGWVQRSLVERAAAYQFALERLMVAVPSPLAVEGERSIKLLQQRTAESEDAVPQRQEQIRLAQRHAQLGIADDR